MVNDNSPPFPYCRAPAGPGEEFRFSERHIALSRPWNLVPIISQIITPTFGPSVELGPDCRRAMADAWHPRGAVGLDLDNSGQDFVPVSDELDDKECRMEMSALDPGCYQTSYNIGSSVETQQGFQQLVHPSGGA